MISRIRRTIPGAPLALAALLAAACGDDAVVSPAAPSGATAGAPDVRLRVAHLSPDAPPVDVLVDGEVVLSGAAFTDVSGYLDIASGTYRIQVTPAGMNDTAVIDATLTLDSGVVYTVAATGLLGDGSLAPLVLTDDLSTVAGARVRVVHASPDAPPVDVALAGGDVLFPDLGYREASAYGEVPAGTYDLEVRVAGTDTVALPIPGLALSGGTTYTVFAIGLVSDGSLGVLPVVDAN